MLRFVAFSLFAALVHAELDPSFNESPQEERFNFVTNTVTSWTITTSTTKTAALTYCYSISTAVAAATSSGSTTASSSSTSTATSTDSSTSTSTSTASTSASTSASATATTTTIPNCRKRRWAFENPLDDYFVDGNGAPVFIATAVLKEDADNVARTAVAGGVEVNPTEEKNTEQSVATGDGRFFLNLATTVTQTFTSVITETTSVQTKTLAITCTPLNIGLNKC